MHICKGVAHWFPSCLELPLQFCSCSCAYTRSYTVAILTAHKNYVKCAIIYFQMALPVVDMQDNLAMYIRCT